MNYLKNNITFDFILNYIDKNIWLYPENKLFGKKVLMNILKKLLMITMIHFLKIQI